MYWDNVAVLGSHFQKFADPLSPLRMAQKIVYFFQRSVVVKALHQLT
jgi:hypothetical protein